MERELNVGKVLEENNGYDEITRDFVTQKKADKQAAMKRRIITENMVEDWKIEINRTNTREMPLNLLRLYEEAFHTIEKILDIELQIMIENRRRI